MKKLKKKVITNNINIGFKPETKCSRVTIDSRVCNTDKFNLLWTQLDNITDYKNTISKYCFKHLLNILDNYSEFLTNYKLPILNNIYLNSWEKQTLFQEIAGHYSETISIYLNKAKYIVKSKEKSNIAIIAQFIHNNSKLNIVEFKLNDLNPNTKYNLKLDNNKHELIFDIESKINQLNLSISNYKENVTTINNNELFKTNNLTKEQLAEITEFKYKISKIEKSISTCEKLILNFNQIKEFKLNKPDLFNRIIKLILTKKVRLISKVKLGVYKTGTHARNINNSNMDIIKDLDNDKYQYFIRFRLHDKLIGREPKNNPKKYESKLEKANPYLKDLAKFNDANFIYLPIIFNTKKLKSIHKNIEDILSQDNPQILIKSEQLRLGSKNNKNKSKKIHIIFNYEEDNKLANVMNKSLNHKNKKYSIIPTERNTIASDINLKHNLLVDSNAKIYDEILKPNINANKSSFINNINQIVSIHSKPVLERTEKEIVQYQKLLRANESLLKNYLSNIIKNWKNDGIKHIVLEDLNFIYDSSYFEHKEIKIKYTRLSRLLRVGQIKHWVNSMAEKQGVFTHFVNSAYTSQECSVCHYISNNNRVKQEDFSCKNPNCSQHGIKVNADYNAAKVIKSRLLNNNLREKLGKDNVYSCSRIKPVYYKAVKPIIQQEYNIGVVTESFPKTRLAKINTSLKTKKNCKLNLAEASSFRSRLFTVNKQ